jgi:hypothetical protein
MDHDFCRSIYTVDPNGIMVEVCLTTRAFTAEEAQSAERLVHAKGPAEFDPPPVMKLYKPGKPQ